MPGFVSAPGHYDSIGTANTVPTRLMRGRTLAFRGPSGPNPIQIGLSTGNCRVHRGKGVATRKPPLKMLVISMCYGDPSGIRTRTPK